MRILVFGANGQVGKELCALQTSHDIVAVTRQDVDLQNRGAAGSFIEDQKPDGVINAAAYTHVDRAEDDVETAFAINAAAVADMAKATAACGAAFVHISTDYVFDGAGDTPLDEDAPVSPLNTYGESKRDGESFAVEMHPHAVILRTSWVYSAHGTNFVKTMLRLGAERDALSIVHDQIGGPTPAGAIAAAALEIMASKFNDNEGSGLYHFQGAPAVSWAEFAETIFETASLSVTVKKIPSSDYPTPATRPLYTVLDCSRILRDFGIQQPDWRSDVAALVRALNDQK